MKSTSRHATCRLCRLLLVLALIGLNSCRWVAREQRFAKEKAALSPLEKFTYAAYFNPDGYLESVNFNWNSPVSDEELAHLEHFVHLRMLGLDGCKFTDAGVAHLAGLTKLEELRVHNLGEPSSVTDAGLGHLRPLKRLKCLSYSQARVSDAGLRHLSELHDLEHLLLDCHEATDQGLRSFAKLEHLRELILFNGKTMSGEGLAALQAPEKLRQLWISNVTDSGIRTITRFSGLRDLSIGGEKLTRDGLLHLRSLKNLEKLEINKAALDNQALEQCVAQVTWLKELRISKCPISGDALKHLRGLKDLEVLRVSAPGIDDRSTPYLAELPKLWFLHLEETAVTEASTAAFLRVRELEELIVPFSEPPDPEFRKKLLGALPKFCRFRGSDGEIKFAKTREDKEEERLRVPGLWEAVFEAHRLGDKK